MVTSGCFIIAEAGVNHNGSLDTAKRLIDTAAHAGADAVKFQTFSAERLATCNAQTADYQKRQTGEETQFEMLKRLELPPAWHTELRDHAKFRSIEFMSTPFDEVAASFLVDLGISRIKVPSGELTNLPFLEKLAGYDLPMIISTGMATLEEVELAVDCVRSARVQAKLSGPLRERVSLLHCTSNYPTYPNDINLLAMQTLQRHFGLPVGFSDHSLGTLFSPVAVALGATIIEKHFTLDRNMPGPDHQASLEPNQLSTLVRHVREVEKALGDGVKAPRSSELPVRNLVRKSIAARRDLPAGHILSEKDVIFLRPGNGLAPGMISSLCGKRLASSVSAGQLLQGSNLE